MFERNDKALRTAHTLFTVVLWVFLIACLIGGIVCSIVFENWLYVLISIFGLLVCFLGWLSNMLIYSFLCDVKFIRNKLYNEGNDGLNDFLMSNKEQIEALDKEEKAAELEEAKLAAEELFKSGMISKEEYENQKREIREREKEFNCKE